MCQVTVHSGVMQVNQSIHHSRITYTRRSNVKRALGIPWWKDGLFILLFTLIHWYALLHQISEPVLLAGNMFVIALGIIRRYQIRKRLVFRVQDWETFALGYVVVLVPCAKRHVH